ncbi:uncharacterized protein LOC120655201 isoform X2 [Panicum virgatum]|uniref:uncharacterized protein LOC120655201 isoform X2 n=1 Tax=Panicum virgatum TaxID=38727 RepID=UPI0019D64E18|nr:uncharacterized protein LOC120655201 isoform X2 [Panicum virgatum]
MRGGQYPDLLVRRERVASECLRKSHCQVGVSREMNVGSTNQDIDQTSFSGMDCPRVLNFACCPGRFEDGERWMWAPHVGDLNSLLRHIHISASEGNHTPSFLQSSVSPAQNLTIMINWKTSATWRLASK